MIDFPCGCSFETDQGKPILDPNIEALSLDCSATWDMICEGNTKGVFQLESQLGQSKAKQVAPRNIGELADLIAVIRPGSLESLVDGKTITEHYIDCKNGTEDIQYLRPELEPVLKSTQGQMIYQEQAMHLSNIVAGFSLGQADSLRKAIGKKKVELMAEVKTDFIKGAKEVGTFTEAEAEEIFAWIEKSQRYSFNASHSVAYAFNAYQTAYCKAHFPRAFFTSYLRHAEGKPKPFLEINELVNNARYMDIEVQPPSILHMNEQFKLINNQPTFGLTNIKKVGKSVFCNLVNIVEKNRYSLKDMGWGQFVMKLGPFIKKDSFIAMVVAGAMDCFGLSRNQMVYEYGIYKDLRAKDHMFLEQVGGETLIKGIQNHYLKVANGKQTVFARRHMNDLDGAICSLQSPPYSLLDTNTWKAKQERDYLGIEITSSEIDDYDTFTANCSCREYIKGAQIDHYAIAARIEDLREWKIKKGQRKGDMMAFLKIADRTCVLDNVTLFSESWEKHKSKLEIGKVVLLKRRKR